jgi:hypothetical protein
MRTKIQGPIVTTVQDGQPYVDEPVRKKVPVFCAKEPMEALVLDHYRRVPLRWMKPGPDGKLVPR